MQWLPKFRPFAPGRPAVSHSVVTPESVESDVPVQPVRVIIENAIKMSLSMRSPMRALYLASVVLYTFLT